MTIIRLRESSPVTANAAGAFEVGGEEHGVVAGVAVDVQQAGNPLAVFEHPVGLFVDGDEMAVGGLQFAGHVATDAARTTKDVMAVELRITFPCVSFADCR